MEPIMNVNSKKERLKLTPEQLFDIYLECNAPGAPVKPILERYGLRPWIWSPYARRSEPRLWTPLPIPENRDGSSRSYP